MAETDEIYEVGWEPGFSGPVCNAVYTLLVLKCYTWNAQDTYSTHCDGQV